MIEFVPGASPLATGNRRSATKTNRPIISTFQGFAPWLAVSRSPDLLTLPACETGDLRSAGIATKNEHGRVYRFRTNVITNAGGTLRQTRFTDSLVKPGISKRSQPLRENVI